jgi:hypothetical protein
LAVQPGVASAVTDHVRDAISPAVDIDQHVGDDVELPEGKDR